MKSSANVHAEVSSRLCKKPQSVLLPALVVHSRAVYAFLRSFTLGTLDGQLLAVFGRDSGCLASIQEARTAPSLRKALVVLQFSSRQPEARLGWVTVRRPCRRTVVCGRR